MHHFTAHRLRFVAEIQTPMELNEHQGSAIRGALFHALRRRFCFEQQHDSCRPCPLHAGCPISFLLATVDDEAQRGADLPRPYTVEPPLGPTARYAPGQPLEFGLTMFSRALSLFPYVVIGVNALQEEGLGRKLEANHWRRGTFRLREVWAENPLTGQRQAVMHGDDALVQVPDVPLQHDQVLATAAALALAPPPRRGAGGEVTLTFLTPTRLTEGGRLVEQPLFRPLLQRLFERLSALARAYSDTPLQLDFRGLLEQAEPVQLAADSTHWVEWESYSTRRRASTPNSGFVGSATYRGQLGPFLPWLLWGQFTHVGKDAVKGNGWYRLEGLP
jgi:hypothetical protein